MPPINALNVTLIAISRSPLETQFPQLRADQHCLPIACVSPARERSCGAELRRVHLRPGEYVRACRIRASRIHRRAITSRSYYNVLPGDEMKHPWKRVTVISK